MNILFVSHETTLGGATLSMLGIIDELAEKNEISVLVRKKNGPLIQELSKRAVNIIYLKYYSWLIPQKKDGIKGKISNVLHRVACGVNYLQAFRSRKIIKKLSLDIIHTNTSVVNIGGILSNLYHIPHIWHIREFGAEDFDLSFVFSDKYSYRFIENHSNKIICVSDALRKKFVQHIEANKVLRIYNGIRFPDNYNRNYGIGNICNILLAGRLSEAKGQNEAMKAISYLKRQGFNNICLHMAGSGDIEKYEKYACKLNISDQVKFYGQIDYLDELRKNMDIEIVCSKKEAFGRVTVEAMSHGLPIIGADTGGTKEIISDGINGLLYEQGKPVSLAEKIKYLILNADCREKIGKEAKRYVRSRYSVQNNAKEIYECYLESIR